MAITSQRCVAKRVAIIGAGASGMAAAKYLIAEKFFDTIAVFEQRSHVGGLWKYTAQSSGDGMFAVPQTDPHIIALERPIPADGKDQETAGTFLSPIYERLETNIPNSLMGYSDAPFGANTQLFPRHETVQKYLEAYGQEIRPKIRFNTQVTTVKPVDASSWTLEYTDLVTGTSHTETFDAVAVATGHFSAPYVPDIDGLNDWKRENPNSISHSKYYRIPEAFHNQKVIVIGSSASGLDIASQLSPVCAPPLLLSQKSVSYLAAGFASDPNINPVPQITHVNAATREVTFADGRVEANIDHLLFCTGYLYTMPFLRELHPAPIGDGTRVQNTYKHLFYAPRPSLAFLTLNQKIIPFPLAEAQSAILARVWSGRLSLPCYAEMAAWEQSVIEERGSGGGFHTLKFPLDAEYINELYDWAASADGRVFKGKMPRRWGAWEYWARENFPAIRKAFVRRGDGRREVRTLGQLGFEFPAGAEDANPGSEKGLEDGGVTNEKGAL